MVGEGFRSNGFCAPKKLTSVGLKQSVKDSCEKKRGETVVRRK